MSLQRVIVTGIIVFVPGILLNETLLMIQGVADINYYDVPYINPLLLLAAIIMFAGILIINYGIKNNISNHLHPVLNRKEQPAA